MVTPEMLDPGTTVTHPAERYGPKSRDCSGALRPRSLGVPYSLFS
jgi:hypothetical protein